jgi:hypothetical protein
MDPQDAKGTEPIHADACTLSIPRSIVIGSPLKRSHEETMQGMLGEAMDVSARTCTTS